MSKSTPNKKKKKEFVAIYTMLQKARHAEEAVKREPEETKKTTERVTAAQQFKLEAAKLKQNEEEAKERERAKRQQMRKDTELEETKKAAKVKEEAEKRRTAEKVAEQQQKADEQAQTELEAHPLYEILHKHSRLNLSASDIRLVIKRLEQRGGVGPQCDSPCTYAAMRAVLEKPRGRKRLEALLDEVLLKCTTIAAAEASKRIHVAVTCPGGVGAVEKMRSAHCVECYDDGECNCDDGYYLNGNSVCKKERKPGSSCSEPHECDGNVCRGKRCCGPKGRSKECTMCSPTGECLQCTSGQLHQGSCTTDQPSFWPHHYRTALLVGNTYNGTIDGVGELRGPKYDIEEVGKALKKLDFKVTIVHDADEMTMIKRLKEFRKDLETRGGVAWFYFSGHVRK